mgnify:CR=1 FL=1
MKVERVNKYYKLLKVIAKKKKLPANELVKIVKEHKCSTSIGTILVDGGVMKRIGTIYHWVSPVCTIDTTVKALANLHTYNQVSYQKRKLERKNLEQEFIATMPKAKVKKPKEVDVNESSDSVTNVTWFWGLYTKTKWY